VTDPSTIVAAETYVLDVPLRRPLADAIYQRTHWRIPVVELRTADGLTGTGYSGVWEGHDLIRHTLDAYLLPGVIDQPSRDIAAVWNRLYWSPLHWVGRAGVAHMALGMIDIALWDLAAQRAGQPLWCLLGGANPTIETYNTDGGWLNFSLAELIEDMVGTVSAGWRRVKMKIGGPDPRVDLERVRKVRSELPDDVQVMVDVNQRWDLVTARRWAPALADEGIDWLEEPLHPDDLLGHRALAAHCPLPIALGENLYNLEAFAAFIDAAAVDIVQVDVTRVAGITEWLRVAHTANSAARWVVPHAGDMMQVHQHLVAATAPPTQRPLLEYLPWGLEVFAEPVQVDNGVLTASDTPGASTRIDPAARTRWQLR
jgi:L-alanine-DL-glutamate epimerase-like enolase superfamily enzyme